MTGRRPTTEKKKAAKKSRVKRSPPPLAELVKLDDYDEDPENPRDHTKSEPLVRASLDRYGAGRGVVSRGTEIVVGNNVFKRAREMGFAGAIRVKPPGRDYLVIVDRSDLTEEEAAGLKIADNRAGEAGGWIPGVLDDLSTRYQLDLESFGFDDETIQRMFDGLQEEESEEDGPGHDFGDFSGTPEENPATLSDVMLIFGDYRGWVPREVYVAFRAAYQAEVLKGGEVMLGDVLRRWIGAAGSQAEAEAET